MEAKLFAFKTVPHEHQRREFELSHAMPARALWWEPGCGKTKPTIDTGASLFLAGEISAMVAIAPTGVQENWAWEEIPAHLPDEVADRTKVFLWLTGKRHQRGFKERYEEFLRHQGFKILCLSYDSMMTDDSAMLVRKFMERHRCLYAADESDKFKTPSAATTKRILASAAWAPYRRVLSGTPVDDSPFDIYTQARFVQPDIWHQFGVRNASAFKTFFGEWQQLQTRDGRCYPSLVRFKNLELMNQTILSLGSRLLKRDVLDLPEKRYERIEFDLSREQQRMHDELRADYQAWFGDGARVTAELAITRMLRMQQLTSGYLPADEEELRPIPGPNPRIAALLRAMELVGDQKVIIWGKYNVDIDTIHRELAPRYKVVVFDGRTSPEERQEAKERFQRGDAQVFLGKASAAGRGLTLHAAKFAIFYNNTFRLLERRQAEDRCHRAGMNAVSPTYIDLVARGTIDEYVLRVLAKKREVAAYVMGDDLPPWV